MAIAIAGRTLDGVEIPAPGKWEIDASHSSVGFSVRHLMVANVRGRFGSFTGTIDIAERPEDSSAKVTMEAASIDTRDEKRDEHLRSPDFFDVEKYPTLSFVSTGFHRTGKTSLELPGELKIRGTARPVTLEVEYQGLTADPWGNTRAVFTATTEIDREDWGLTWNMALETGGVLVGKKVKIELEIEAVLQS